MVIERNNNKKGVTPGNWNMNEWRGVGSVYVFINRKVVKATAPVGLGGVLIKFLTNTTL